MSPNSNRTPDLEQASAIARDVRRFIPMKLTISRWSGLREALDGMYQTWPEHVSPPQKIGESQDPGYPILHSKVGRGAKHIVFNCDPHGGEPYGISAGIEWALYLCEHPWLLEDWTLHLVFCRPKAIELNDIWAAATPLLLDSWILYHYRQSDPFTQHSYAFPNGKMGVDPNNPGAKALIALAEQILETSGQRIALWLAGHNGPLLSGGAAIFHVSGPRARSHARIMEHVASCMNLRPHRGFPDGPQLILHRGSRASYQVPFADEMRRFDPNCNIPASEFDWARGNIPDVTMALSEIPLWYARHADLRFKKMTLGKASAIANQRLARFQELLAQASLIAERLDGKDPLVVATRDIFSPLGRWPDALPDDDKKLSIYQAAEIAALNPLHVVRNSASAFRMLWKYNAELTRAESGFRNALWNEAFRIIETCKKDVTFATISPHKGISTKVAAFQALAENIGGGIAWEDSYSPVLARPFASL